MKRTGFAIKTIERKPPAPLTPIRQLGEAAPAKVVGTPKREYVRSKVLMQAYRLIPCQHCGRDDGTVCGAHSNWAIHGKGRSIKADDNRCASLCHECHVFLDQGSMLSEPARQIFWWRAHICTIYELTGSGVWPDDVPIPDQNLPKQWR